MMNEDEQNRVSSVSNWYLQEQLDFDKKLIGFRYKSIQPHIKGPEGLELGPAEGQMTQFLINDFKNLTLVEGASELLNLIPSYPNIKKVHSMFEDFNPDQQYNTIIMDHILEHIENPVELLNRTLQWVAPNGRFILGVPNGNSFHRLAAVKMGLLKHQCDLNSRDLSHGHRRVYTHSTFRKDIEAAGMKIVFMGGVFFKPISNKQIQENWSDEMIQGFFELGKDFPENAADILAVCERE